MLLFLATITLKTSEKAFVETKTRNWQTEIRERFKNIFIIKVTPFDVTLNNN